MWKEYTSALLGLGILAVAFLSLSSSALMWTLGILGAAVLVFALWGAHTWEEYVNAVLGLCVIAVPFMGLTDAALLWTLVIGGAAVIVLALWEVIATSPSSPSSSATHSHA